MHHNSSKFIIMCVCVYFHIMHEHIVWSLQGIPWAFGKSLFPSNYPPPLSCSKVFPFFFFFSLSQFFDIGNLLNFPPQKQQNYSNLQQEKNILFLLKTIIIIVRKKAPVMMNLLCFQTLFKFWIQNFGCMGSGGYGFVIVILLSLFPSSSRLQIICVHEFRAKGENVTHYQIKCSTLSKLTKFHT